MRQEPTASCECTKDGRGTARERPKRCGAAPGSIPHPCMIKSASLPRPFMPVLTRVRQTTPPYPARIPQSGTVPVRSGAPVSYWTKLVTNGRNLGHLQIFNKSYDTHFRRLGARVLFHVQKKSCPADGSCSLVTESDEGRDHVLRYGLGTPPCEFGRGVHIPYSFRPVVQYGRPVRHSDGV